jgi:predicted GH43/DUF377 family glycosyl hydrolase
MNMFKKLKVFGVIIVMCLVTLFPLGVSAGDSSYVCNLAGLWNNTVYEKRDTVNTSIGGSFNMHFADFVTVGTTIKAYYIDNDAYGKKGIGLATSTDGIIFTNQGNVLSTTPGGWDANQASFPGIWYDNGTYYLVYEGTGSSTNGDIGLATSTNGTTFTKQGKILTHNTSGWESTNIGTPDLYKVGTTWYLTYHGFNGTDCQVGVATGTSLTALTKYTSNPVIATAVTGADSGTIGRRDIIYENGYYYMVYEISTDQPYDNAKWSHSFARSTDLLSWTKLPQKNIIAQTSTSYGNDGPAFLQLSGVTWIYYRVAGNVTRRARIANELNGGYNKVVETENMAHQCGRAVGDAWSADGALDAAGYMAYEWSNDIPVGECTAVVKAMIDVNSGNNVEVIRIDVRDVTTSTLLQSRSITRTMFTATSHYEFFSVPFIKSTAGDIIEVSVYWDDQAYILTDRVLYNF